MVAPEKGAALVVDCGYSHSYVVPFFQGMPMKHAATRVDVGGKLLQSLLMETLSFKEVNLMGEQAIVHSIFEQCCFVSQKFDQDMQIAQAGGLTQEFVLPDFKTIKRGFLKTEATEDVC